MAFSFGEVINTFVRQIRSIHSITPLFAQSLASVSKKFREEYLEFLQKEGSLEPTTEQDTPDEKRFRIPRDKSDEANRHEKRVRLVDTALDAFTESLVLSLVSQFDCYMGQLIRAILTIRPEKLLASEKNLTYADLFGFTNIDDAKEQLLEKEIESVLRESHPDQFRWLERKLDNTPLTKDLPSWPTLIELTQRRNLFAHCGGAVSRQYIRVCTQHGVILDEGITVGKRLTARPKYIRAGHDCLLDIGVKLGQVVWRKLQPDKLREADSNLTSITYDLIASGQYQISQSLLEFATKTLKRNSSPEYAYIFLVNLAQSYKWDNKPDQVTKLLHESPWDHLADKFRIAHAVLLDDFDNAFDLMRRIGSRGDILKSDYLDWPLFREFRKQADFPRAYQEVFGEPIPTVEETARIPASATLAGTPAETSPSLAVMGVQQ